MTRAFYNHVCAVLERPAMWVGEPSLSAINAHLVGWLIGFDAATGPRPVEQDANYSVLQDFVAYIESVTGVQRQAMNWSALAEEVAKRGGEHPIVVARSLFKQFASQCTIVDG